MNTNTFKKILLILIGVIVVGGAAAYVYITQTNKEVEPFISASDKTTIGEAQPPVVEKHPDWKTCKNKAYGYEFSYPSNWNVTSRMALSGEGNPGAVSRSSFKGCENVAVFLDGMTILVNAPNDFTEKYLRKNMANGNTIRFVKELNLNGINTFWFETNCDDVSGECDGAYFPFVYFIKDDILFYILPGSDLPLVEDIIKTFKFNVFKKSTDVIDPDNLLSNIFTSFRLGIQFRHTTSIGDVVEYRDKLSLNGEDEFVDIYFKDKDQNIEDAIKNTFFPGEFANLNCILKKVDYISTEIKNSTYYMIADKINGTVRGGEIDDPSSPDYNPSSCRPERYSVFVYSADYPDRFIYIQYTIQAAPTASGISGKWWYNTIRFIQ